MSFVNMKYFVPILLLTIGFIFLTVKYEKNYFSWIEKYWFFKRSKASTLATVFYSLGFGLLILSFLDLRGPEEQINAKIADQKTIVIIDSSASMLVEDVRPNRFSKAILMARHFVKKTVGHQVAIVVFSDTQKRLIPFTDDLDLLDARIAALEDMNLNNGGSNIIQAIKESIQYFKADLSEGEDIVGNILVFTDSEDNGSMESVDIPDGVSLGVVAIGTLKGGRIPIRTPQGAFRGFKKFKNQEIISKLDENFLKKLGAEVENFKYWVAQSYTMPTEEVLNFFRNKFQTKMSQGNVRIRPVKGYNLISLGIIFLIISFVLRTKKSLILPLLILGVFVNFDNISAQESVDLSKLNDEQKLMVEKLMNLDKQGELDRKGRLKLAELMAADGKAMNSLKLYEENIDNFDQHSDSELFNYGTILLQNKKINEGVLLLDYLKERIKNDANKNELRSNINKNILKALEIQKQEEQKKNKKGEGDNKNKNEGDSEDQQEDGSGKPQDGDKNQKKNKDGKKDKDKEKDKKQQQGDGDQKKKQKPQSLKEKEDDIKKKRKMVKIPAVIKQILNDDRELQKQYQKTSVKKGSQDKKDW